MFAETYKKFKDVCWWGALLLWSYSTSDKGCIVRSCDYLLRNMRWVLFIVAKSSRSHVRKYCNLHQFLVYTSISYNLSRFGVYTIYTPGYLVERGKLYTLVCLFFRNTSKLFQTIWTSLLLDLYIVQFEADVSCYESNIDLFWSIDSVNINVFLRLSYLHS